MRPTRGPLITDAARAGDADATAVELNPGPLGLLPGGSLELVAAGGTAASAARRRARGAARASTGRAPICGPHALGFGLTGVTGSATAPRLRHRRPHDAAPGVRAAPRALGGARRRVGPHLERAVRRHRHLRLRVVDPRRPLRRAGRRRWRTPGSRRRLPRLWNAELALRPLGTDRLELAFGARARQRRRMGANRAARALSG